MKKPFVSFIIPTYNSEKYLPLCLESIKKQDYPQDRYETFVIDGGSTDGTLSIAKKYKVKICKSPKR
jgi:glycosyltransferase involved in cell wall biosynthesis